MKTQADFTCLSLGAGVQSTALLIMSNNGLHDCPRADVAIFADTGCEPKWVYEQVDRLEAWSDIPIVKVSAGDLIQDVTERRDRGEQRFATIPAWINTGAPRPSLARRQCTREYKIAPIEKYVRSALGYKKRQHVKKRVASLLGISWDEATRARSSRTCWVENRFPLMDAHLKRHDCVEIIKREGIPVPGKSSCFICPFHGDDYWRHLKRADTESFLRACEFDLVVRGMSKEGLANPAFLHKSCKPLSEVRLGNGQMTFDWDLECEGICGT